MEAAERESFERTQVRFENPGASIPGAPGVMLGAREAWKGVGLAGPGRD